MKDENKIEEIVKTPLFTLYGKKRKTPHEYSELADAVDKFKIELFKPLKVKIEKILEWLSKRLK